MMKAAFPKLLFWLFLMVPFTGAMASSEQVLKLVLKDTKGESFPLTLVSYKNHLDSLEVRIEARNLPRLNKTINPLLGFGRDTDDNGKIDTWFFITKNGMDSKVQEGQSPLGQDILASLLVDKYHSSWMMSVTSAASSLLSYLFLSAHEGQSIEEQFYKDFMDLEENRLAFEKDLVSMQFSHTYDQIQFHYQMTSLGLKELARKMDTFGKRDFWGYALADIGLWMTGGIVLKWAGALLQKAGIIASETAFITSIKETLLSFFEKQKALLENKMAAVKGKILPAKNSPVLKKGEQVSGMVLTNLTWKTALVSSIKARKTKSKILLTVLKTLKFPVKALKAAGKEWKYIAMNSSVQISAEAFARYDEIKDPNPAVMAQNLLGNEEVIQNVSFMAAESIMMTGISKNLKTTKARFMASGAVAITNSSIMNFGIKDDPDMKRVAFDTAWETLIGNSQVQLDLKALEYFEKMALKKNNPKIKLVGYAVALIDMGVGYVVYSKSTSALSEPKVMLIPVLAVQ